MSPFTLGRMRHLDLLALWHQLHPNSRERDVQVMAQMAPGYLAAALLNGSV